MKRLTDDERATIALNHKNGKLSRQKLEQLVMRYTGKDFKSAPGEPKSILRNMGGAGTCIVYLESMTDAELLDELGIKVGT